MFCNNCSIDRKIGIHTRFAPPPLQKFDEPKFYEIISIFWQHSYSHTIELNCVGFELPYRLPWIRMFECYVERKKGHQRCTTNFNIKSRTFIFIQVHFNYTSHLTTGKSREFRYVFCFVLR